MRYLYLKVTKDKYELPLCVADTMEKLANKCGVTKGAIAKSLFDVKHGVIKQSQYKRVELIDNDN